MHRRTPFFAAILLASTAAIAGPAPRFAPWGISLADMDKAVAPGDDFFRYVNGTWLAKTPIAPDRVTAGVDVALADGAEHDVRAIAESQPAGSQIGDLYASWMDEAGIEKAGVAPLRPYLAQVAAIRDTKALAHLFQQPGWASPASIGIQADQNNPGHYTATLDQSGLGMPSRDYYLLPGAKYDAFRAAYVRYVTTILILAGFPDAAARAQRIMALETALATSQWTPERNRDVAATNNPMTVAQLQALAPQFDWEGSLATAGFPGPVASVLVSQPTAIKAAGALVGSTPLDTWKDYLAFHFASDHAAYLPKAFDDASFAFFRKTLNDQPEQRPRWKRGVALVNRFLGEAVGKIYVERHYPPESDRQMAELIANLRAAYGEELAKLAWMDAPTRREAQIKLASFDPRVGHPKTYIDYTPYKVVRGDMLGNAVRGEQFLWALQLQRYPKPVDRGLWYMTPQTVNAYYDPTLNQITFPAAILQAPYFDPAADPAVNYGGIGATIGHEMGHGFDDQGRLFDATGKVRDWWTKASGDRFQAHTAVLGRQFDSYEPVPGVHIKGGLTMGENVGDLGGLEMAWGAWRRYVAAHGDPGVKDGYTADQRFLLAYAYSWQDKEREGALRQGLLSDPHSPPEYRVNGIVRNFDPWYAAFGVKPGAKLYLPPAQRVHIWMD